MINLYLKLFNLFIPKEKYFYYLFIPLTIILFFVELLSIGLILPLVSLIVNQEKFIKITLLLDNEIINDFIDSFANSYEYLFFYFLLIYLFIFFLKNTFILIYNWLIFSFSNSVHFRISSEIFEKYLSLDYLDFGKANYSKIANDIKSESNSIKLGIRHSIIFFSEIFIILGLVIIIFLYDFKSATFSFLTLFICTIIYYTLVKKKNIELGYERYKLNNILLKNVLNSFNGFKVIKIYDLENFFLNLHKKKFYYFLKNNKITSLLNILPRLWIELSALISIVVYIFFIMKKGTELNELLPILSLIAIATIRIIPSINKILLAVQNFRNITVSINMISNLLNNKNLKKNLKWSKDKILFEHNLKLENISFKFPDRKNKIFNNINLELPKNQLIGLKGKSGEGKSTLINLILGIIKPEKGKILLDGLEVNLSNKNWLKKIGYVSQDTFILDDTIEKNIILDRNKYLIKQNYFEEIIKISELEDFIKDLPDGLATVVGENGAKISGGQKQRIGIARALLSNPEILILDEPTSSLDAENSKKFFDLMVRLKFKKTIFLVSHILYNEDLFDRIYELNEGKLSIFK